MSDAERTTFVLEVGNPDSCIVCNEPQDSAPMMLLRTPSGCFECLCDLCSLRIIETSARELARQVAGERQRQN